MGAPAPAAPATTPLRFDDEFVRHGLYRNFHDPYEREWRGGNSRWDLLDALRLMHALRPDGIAWRQREDGGGTSFKLEHLAEDNGLRIGEAHEALSDVRALIGSPACSAATSRNCGTTRCACATSAMRPRCSMSRR